MAYVWILLISSLTVTNSFLLSNSSSPVRVTSPQFQHLSQLIFNEEQSRHHVENEVTSIELRVARLERDLRAKYDANLKQMEDMYNRKLLNLTDSFKEREKDIGMLLNATIEVLKRQNREIKKNLTDVHQMLAKTEMQCSSMMTELTGNISRQGGELAKNIAAVVANAAKITKMTIEISTINPSTSLDRANVVQLRQKIGKFYSLYCKFYTLFSKIYVGKISFF